MDDNLISPKLQSCKVTLFVCLFLIFVNFVVNFFAVG